VEATGKNRQLYNLTNAVMKPLGTPVWNIQRLKAHDAHSRAFAVRESAAPDLDTQRVTQTLLVALAGFSGPRRGFRISMTSRTCEKRNKRPFAPPKVRPEGAKLRNQ
jgi:hypothetical protein